MHSESFEMFTLPTFLLLLMVNLDIVQATGLLASSLFRFRETVCDGKMLHITCPEGSVISIQFSQYGHSSSDYQTCTSITTYFGEQLQMARDTDCFVSNALEVLLRICQDKRRCQLEASIETFTKNADPCPNKSKYLEVAYQCRPTEFHKKLACENENLSLKCRRSNRIVVYSAMLRHFPWNKTMCPKIKPDTLFNCKTPHVAEQAVKGCQGRKHCIANVASSLFGELCPQNSQKYLEVVYTCVPKRILRTNAQDHKLKKVTPHPKKSKGRSHQEIKEPVITGQSWEPDVRGQQDPAIIHHFQMKNKVTSDITATTTTSTTTTTTMTTPTTTTTTSTTTTPSSKTAVPVVIYSPTPSTPEFRADIAQLNPLANIPKLRPGGTIREVRGGNSGSDSNPVSTEPNSEWTLHCINTTSRGKKSKEKAMNVVADWLGLFYLLRKNREKATLYFILGVCVGTICLLLAIIVKLIVVSKRKTQAKLDLTEPTHSQHVTPVRNNHIGNSSPSPLRRATSDEFIDFVGFGPRTATLRTDPGNRSLNYF